MFETCLYDAATRKETQIIYGTTQWGLFLTQLVLQQSEYASMKTRTNPVSKLKEDAFGNMLTYLNYKPLNSSQV